MGSRKIPKIQPTPDPRPKRSPEEAAFEQAILAAELGEAALIDLHGLDKDDAVREVDAFIAHESARGTEVVKIIHGRGTGRLRDAILSHLKRHPLVPYARDALQNVYEQGGVIYAVLHDARMKS